MPKGLVDTWALKGFLYLCCSVHVSTRIVVVPFGMAVLPDWQKSWISCPGLHKCYLHPILGCWGDLVGLLSSVPYRASYGLLWWLMGDTKLTY